MKDTGSIQLSGQASDPVRPFTSSHEIEHWDAQRESESRQWSDLPVRRAPIHRPGTPLHHVIEFPSVSDSEGAILQASSEVSGPPT